MTKLISLIVPAYNEEKNIPLIYQAIKKVFEYLVDYDFELVFVDDGSRDKSLEVMKKIAIQDAHVHYLEFSRNFGKEAATSAGLLYATGDAAMMLDADMQHPPGMIPQFLEKWKAGADVVVGVREKNTTAGWIKNGGSAIFYDLINRISQTKITARATDFRLMSRQVLDEMNKLTERNRMTRALIDWLGYKREYVYFEAAPRAHGTASYSLIKLAKLAINSMVSLSLFPLKLAGYLGILIVSTSGPLGLFILIEKYLLNDPWHLKFSGPAILAVIILFLVGIVLACLGLISLYIAHIHEEVINRPMFIVKKEPKDYRGFEIFNPSFTANLKTHTEASNKFLVKEF